jgi:hypothetical protein
MPQNEFCGYENPAFQAQKTPSNTEISIAVEVFNSPANLCLKGNNLHNRRYATCGQRHPYHCCLKGRILNILNALMVYIFLFEKLSARLQANSCELTSIHS